MRTVAWHRLAAERTGRRTALSAVGRVSADGVIAVWAGATGGGFTHAAGGSGYGIKSTGGGQIVIQCHTGAAVLNTSRTVPPPMSGIERPCGSLRGSKRNKANDHVLVATPTEADSSGRAVMDRETQHEAAQMVGDFVDWCAGKDVGEFRGRYMLTPDHDPTWGREYVVTITSRIVLAAEAGA